MKRITIFTPTYNRSHLIKRLYNSLLKQSNKEFVWLIIDDGSVDNTRSIVREWIKDGYIEIIYYYKENGGLHTGYNKAIELIDTELSICIDSDDWMPTNAVELILDYWDKYKTTDCAGIIGLDFDPNYRIIGDFLPKSKYINPIDLLSKNNKGDKKYVVRTDIYKKVAPIPTLNNEKNFNPHYLILKMCKEYYFLVLNKPLCIVDYQNDGMSANIYKQYLNSPNSFAELRRVILELDTSWLYLYKTAIHYVSSCLIAKQKHIIKNSPRKGLVLSAFPFGILLSIFIRINKNKILKIK